MSSRNLHAIPPYIFWELDARRTAHRERGRTLVDLGIGSPDQAIPHVVIEAMQRAIVDRKLSGYPDFLTPSTNVRRDLPVQRQFSFRYYPTGRCTWPALRPRI